MAKWATTKTPLPLPEFLDRPIERINNVLEFIIALLDIALATLEVVRAFALGYLDPLAAILKAIINELENLILDLTQVGVFLHGDWYIAGWPPNELRGGYGAYEQRMVARFLDRTDPNRPDFTASTTALAVFFYVGAPIEQVSKIIQFIRAILRFFQREERIDVLPRVTNLRVGYGFENASFYQLAPSRANDAGVIEQFGLAGVANVTWELSAASRINPNRPAVFPPNHGFLVTLSTVQQGLFLSYSRPNRDNTQDGEGNQDRQVGFYTDREGRPIRLYGGDDQIVLSEGVDWNSAYRNGRIEPGARQAYAVRDPSDTLPIPLELLKDGDQYLLQRTFYVPPSFLNKVIYQNKKFGFRLLKEDLPYEADFEANDDGTVQVVPGSVQQATTIWMRVQAVSQNIENNTDFRYNIIPIISDLDRIEPVGDIDFSDVGQFSEAIQVTFPTDQTDRYIRSIEAALAVMFLSRSDIRTQELIPDVAGKTIFFSQVSGGTGLETAAAAFFNQLFNLGSAGTYFGNNQASERFRRVFRRRIRRLADRIYRTGGAVPQSLINSVVERAEAGLINWKWTDSDAITLGDASLLPDVTILESLEDPYTERLHGVCKNFNSIFDFHRNQVDRQAVQGYATANGQGMDDALDQSQFVKDDSIGRTPIMYGAPEDVDRSAFDRTEQGKIWLCRTLFDEDVYETAAYVLQIAAAPGAIVRGGWVSFRLFPQGIPAVDRILLEVVKWAKSFLQGIQGLTQAILDYIAFLESRIIELQELIRRIQRYLSVLDSIDIPQSDVLLVTGAGTAGLLTEFLEAEDKPDTSSADYGGGIVMVSGGIPTFVLDLLTQALGDES